LILALSLKRLGPMRVHLPHRPILLGGWASSAILSPIQTSLVFEKNGGALLVRRVTALEDRCGYTLFRLMREKIHYTAGGNDEIPKACSTLHLGIYSLDTPEKEVRACTEGTLSRWAGDAITFSPDIPGTRLGRYLSVRSSARMTLVSHPRCASPRTGLDD
jgi:hypothetical protein